MAEKFSIQHSAFSIQHSAFSIQHSAFSIQHSAFSIIVLGLYANLMKRLSIFLFLPLWISNLPAKDFDFKPGFYQAGNPQEKALWEALAKSSVTMSLSGHAGISLPSKSGNGRDHNLSIEQLKIRLKEVSNKEQATIFEEKNFTGKDQLDQKVEALLKELGFKTIVIQVAHGQGTIIEKVIRN